MAAFESAVSSMAVQNFLGIYAPFIVAFLVIGSGIYYLLGRTTYIENLEGLAHVAVKASITLVLAGIASTFVVGLISMFV